eukprot:1157414-Pelagomonas_calceolata.AAC.3
MLQCALSLAHEYGHHLYPRRFCYVRFLIPMSDQEEKDLYELRSNAILDSDCGTGDDDLSHPMPCSSAGGGDGSEEDEGEQEEKEEENVPKKPSGSGAYE